MLKVVTIVGTRPEIIRLSRIIPKLDSAFDHTLIHTGQNYDYSLNEIFFNDLDIREPDIYLEAAGKSPMQTISSVIEKIDLNLEKIKPDAVLILEIPIVLEQKLFLQKEGKFQFFTWKLETAVLTLEFQKRSIEKL